MLGKGHDNQTQRQAEETAQLQVRIQQEETKIQENARKQAEEVIMQKVEEREDMHECKRLPFQK